MHLPYRIWSWGTFLALCLADPAPQVVSWNKEKVYGPDGPWQVFYASIIMVRNWTLTKLTQAISIDIGTDHNGRPLDPVDVFPAGVDL